MECPCQKCNACEADVILNGVFQLCWDCYAEDAKTQKSSVWRDSDSPLEGSRE